MSYIRFVWFVLQRTSSKETWVTRFAENATGQDMVTGIVDYAIANNSVVVGGPFKTRKDASNSQQDIVEAARPDLRAAIAKDKFDKLMNMTETLDMLKRLGKK